MTGSGRVVAVLTDEAKIRVDVHAGRITVKAFEEGSSPEPGLTNFLNSVEEFRQCLETAPTGVRKLGSRVGAEFYIELFNKRRHVAVWSYDRSAPRGVHVRIETVAYAPEVKPSQSKIYTINDAIKAGLVSV